MVTFVGIWNTSAALTDAYREGYPTLDGYLFIGTASLIPMAIGVVAMSIVIGRRLTTYLLWSAGSLVALLPGLLLWTVCAAMPTPRSGSGVGQMHIFFLPMIHIGYCSLVYFGTGLIAVVVSRAPEA
jgi:hypothetical protein